MNTVRTLVFTAIAVCACLVSAKGLQQHIHVFLKQRNSPVSAVSESDNAVVLKNVSNKKVTGYTLACFKKTDRTYAPIATFTDSKVPIAPSQTLFEGGFDAYPVPHACTARHALVGVAKVAFADGTSWTSSLMKNAPRELEKIRLPNNE